MRVASGSLPAPWKVREADGCMFVVDGNGTVIASIGLDLDPDAAKLLAQNIAKLPALVSFSKRQGRGRQRYAHGVWPWRLAPCSADCGGTSGRAGRHP